jgi:hypothetical protein
LKDRNYSQVIQPGILRFRRPPGRKAKCLSLRARLGQRFLLFAW